MLKFSYSTNGLTNLDLFTAINEVKKAGYEGVELSFQFNQFDPFTLTDEECLKIKNFFEKSKIKPVCISTATAIFISDIPHEPSLISLAPERRKQRINLIKRGIDIAKKVGVPIVSFQSGYLRKEHIDNPLINSYELLIDGIKECLTDIGDINLVIEPEPGMFIETIEQTLKLINDVDNPNFGLHLDIGHAYCTEDNYIDAIKKSIPFIKYMHLADIKEGFNLKLVCLSSYSSSIPEIDIESTGYLLHIIKNDTVIFIDRDHIICFYNYNLKLEDKNDVLSFTKQFNDKVDIKFVNKKSIDEIKSNLDIDLEIKAYLSSVAGIDFGILKKSVPILKYLRCNCSDVIEKVIKNPICNTINGKVHYHEIPGSGGIDFYKVLNTLNDNNYTGYITVELYNHSDVWESVLSQSRKYLLSCLNV